MTEDPNSSARLAEATRLSVLLAERVLDALIMKRAFPADDAVTLAKAARLLQDYGVEWPPLLTQAMHSLAAEERVPPPDDEQPKGLADIVSGGLSRFFAKPRSEPEQS